LDRKRETSEINHAGWIPRDSKQPLIDEGIFKGMINNGNWIFWLFNHLDWPEIELTIIFKTSIYWR